MAYATAELNVLVSPPGGGAGTLWDYKNSADDTLVAQRGAGFFSDGEDKGMKVGDKILTTENTGVGAVLEVSAISAAGAATAT